MRSFKKFCIFLIVAIAFLLVPTISSAQKTEVDFFYKTSCSACAQMKPFLEDLQKEYDLQINFYETSKNSELFIQRLEEYNVPSNRRGYVPSVFINGKYFIGFSSEIASAIESLLQGNEISDDGTLIGETVRTKILGLWDVELSLKNRSLFGTGLVLGFLDSINVCSITVLVFLILYSLSVGSAKRAFKIGLIFTIVVFIFYATFMILLTGVMGLFVNKYGLYIRIAMTIISLVAGLLLIKDFFWYGKGISLAIPSSAKPVLEKYIKRATIGSTVLLALFASLVEIPCTAIFPLIYVTLLTSAGIEGIQRIIYILIYNLIYVWPLLFIVVGTYFSWSKIEDIDAKVQKSKGWMKLIAGIALVLFAIYFAWPFLF